MNLTPVTSLTWAYQLHYYLCFRTHRRRPLFTLPERAKALTDLLSEICGRHDYHLLKQQPYSEQVRCLVSLQPSHSIAKVIQTIKANSSREFALQFSLSETVWARGYLARSTGRMRIGAVRRYLEQQSAHHGYDARLLPPVYKYRAPEPMELKAAHACFDLSHYLVFATSYRKGIFTSTVGKALVGYWLRVAAQRHFAIDQVSVVPDHVHLIVRIVPKMSIEEVALSLMNNGQYFIGKHFPMALIENGMNSLWSPSAYAGTCGEVSTALIKTWLNSAE